MARWKAEEHEPQPWQRPRTAKTFRLTLHQINQLLNKVETQECTCAIQGFPSLTRTDGALTKSHELTALLGDMTQGGGWPSIHPRHDSRWAVSPHVLPTAHRNPPSPRQARRRPEGAPPPPSPAGYRLSAAPPPPAPGTRPATPRRHPEITPTMPHCTTGAIETFHRTQSTRTTTRHGKHEGDS
jgi:hypothetical protein